jgi:hypothetical protein
LRTLEQIDKEIELVIDSLDKLQKALVVLMYEKSNVLAVLRGAEASAQILTEKLMERIKQ